MYRFTTPAVLLACTVLQAQDIQFDPGHWTSSTIATQQEHALLYENRLLSDTMFVEDSSTLALEMVVASPTLARVEFDPTTRTRVRRPRLRVGRATRLNHPHRLPRSEPRSEVGEPGG